MGKNEISVNLKSNLYNRAMSGEWRDTAEDKVLVFLFRHFKIIGFLIDVAKCHG